MGENVDEGLSNESMILGEFSLWLKIWRSFNLKVLSTWNDEFHANITWLR